MVDTSNKDTSNKDTSNSDGSNDDNSNTNDESENDSSGNILVSRKVANWVKIVTDRSLAIHLSNQSFDINFTIWSNRQRFGEISNLMEATQCETVDEFAFVIPKNIFDENPFITFYPSWHLYAVEYCLRMRSIGHRVCVFPLSVWHRSEGDSFDPSYFKTIKPIARKYRYEFKKISTTMGGWATNNLGLNLHIARYRFSLWRKQSKQQLKCLFKLVI